MAVGSRPLTPKPVPLWAEGRFRARHTTGWWDTLNQRTGQLAGELADPALNLRDGELAPAPATTPARWLRSPRICQIRSHRPGR